MEQLLITHKDEIRGCIGAIMAFVSPFLTDLGLIIQVIAGLGGLVLLGYSIAHKHTQLRQEIRKLKKMEEDEENFTG